MKRTFSRVLMVAALAALFALTGCEAIGFGNDGDGVPQTAQATVAPPAIIEEGTLRVGVDGANAPFSTLVSDKLVGIDVDIAAALADRLGLKVQVVDVGSEPEKALDAGTVDVIMGVDTSDTAATCWMSDPYLNTAVGIFATTSGALLPEASSNPTIEAQESSMSAWEITNQFGEGALKAVSDLRTAFDDLEAGNVSYVASDAIIGTYVTHTSGGRAMLIGLMQTPGGYCVGVNPDNTDLKTAVQSAVGSLATDGTVSTIEAKWIGSAIDFNGVAYTDFSGKPETQPSSSSSQDSKLGKVGSNAVDLTNQPSSSSAATTDPAATTTETQQNNEGGTTYVDLGGGTDTTNNNTYTEPAQTYTEPEPVNTEPEPVNTEPEETYVEPEPEPTYTEPEYTETDTGGAEADTGGAEADTGGAEADAGGEAEG